VTAFALAVRLGLAIMFAVAGVAKLVDLSGTAEAVAGFGVPRGLAGGVARLLTIAELGCAVALFVSGWAWYGAIGALALLGAFVVAVSANLARGRTPDCHCFGQLHSAPVGRWTAVRAGGLAALAAIVVARGPRGAELSPVRWIGELRGGEIALGAVTVVLVLVVAALTWFLLELFQQHGRVLARLEALEQGAAGEFAGLDGARAAVGASGLPIGSVAPSFSAAGADGALGSLSMLLARGRPVLLVFSDPRPAGRVPISFRPLRSGSVRTPTG
jgi:uncharacterized membrane protein YphA (DoxX/SURF4 family)